MRCVLLAFLTGFAAYSQLAVTDHGALYFTTNLSTTGGDSRSKLYRLDAESLSFIADGAGDSPFGTIIVSPFASGDGGVTGYGIVRPCAGGSCGMFLLPRTRFIVSGITLPQDDYDSMTVSRNGRYLAGVSYDFRSRVIDLPSLSVREFPQYMVPNGPPSIDNSGAIVVRDASSLTAGLVFIPHNGEPRGIPGTSGAQRARISPDGQRIVYDRTIDSRTELILTDPTGAMQRILATVPRQFYPFQTSFANDGSLLFLQPDGDTSQAILLRTGTADAVALPTVAAGVLNAIIQGDGQSAWLVSASNQYLYVPLSDGMTVTERIPASPYVSNNTLFGTPGSVVRIPGAGISKDTIITSGDVRFPVNDLQNRTAAVQIPWELPAQPASVPITIQGPGSPFRQTLNLTILRAPTISFERDPWTSALQAAHQDFRGVISPQDPALPGETIHVFARNMGPVDQHVETGQSSPTSPAARVVTPFACYLFTYKSPGELNPARGLVVPFAGLSGGSVGVYQIDVTIPADWPAGKSYLSCTMPSATNTYGGDSADIAVGAL